MKTPVIPRDQREILDAGWFGITLLVSLPIYSFYHAEKNRSLMSSLNFENEKI